MATLDIWTLGEQYINSPAHSFSPAVEQEIRDFCALAWQEEIASKGIAIKFVEYQPYASAKAMREAFAATDVLEISQEGNITEQDPHPYAADPELNLKHRAVHDYHHIALKAGFNAPGEITASAHMVSLARAWGFSDEVQQFLFCDMVGQLGHYYATGGSYSDDQKVVLFEMGLIDELVRLYEDLGPAGLIAYLKPIDQAARARHGWITQSAH